MRGFNALVQAPENTPTPPPHTHWVHHILYLPSIVTHAGRWLARLGISLFNAVAPACSATRRHTTFTTYHHHLSPIRDGRSRTGPNTATGTLQNGVYQLRAADAAFTGVTGVRQRFATTPFLCYPPYRATPYLLAHQPTTRHTYSAPGRCRARVPYRRTTRFMVDSRTRGLTLRHAFLTGLRDILNRVASDVPNYLTTSAFPVLPAPCTPHFPVANRRRRDYRRLDYRG